LLAITNYEAGLEVESDDRAYASTQVLDSEIDCGANSKRSHVSVSRRHWRRLRNMLGGISTDSGKRQLPLHVHGKRVAIPS